jgi:anthranilate phosphoribosyltransferase
MFAGVLKNLGTKKAFVVHGSDGLDEATVTGKTRVTELNNGLINTYDIDPSLFFDDIFSGDALLGGDATVNAEITKSVLTGGSGACRNIVLLNAALAIMAGEMAKSVRDGIEIAKECIDSGAAIKKLQALIELSNS